MGKSSQHLLVIICSKLVGLFYAMFMLAYDTFFNARSMDVFITKLRKYFKTDPKVEIVNVRGIGYKLIG